MKTWRTMILGSFLFASFVSICTAAEPQRQALLIACSDFPNAPSVKPLPGARNDVARFAELLSSPKFNFRDIETLAGWTEGSDRNPTAENIEAAFERLISKSGRDDQVFILMSGHGVQVDVLPNKSDSLGLQEEPDGKDEAFIAADYGPEERVIRDDTIGNWLDRLKNKGAHVWVVFDCCHSGSLTRGEGDEEPRRLLTDESRQAIQNNPRRDSNDTGIVDIVRPASALDHENATDSQGSLVALFAAQNYETTPEMTRPVGAVASSANRRGLLSYHLEYLLNNVAGKTTYRDLENALAGRYYAERGMSGPNPYAEGDLDRTLFGLETIEPNSSLGLLRKKDQYELRGGMMDGVTVGTVLEVTLDGEAIGAAEAVEVGLNRSSLRWTKAPPENVLSNQESLSKLSCQIAEQPVIPWKVAVQWLAVSDAATPISQPLQNWIAERQKLDSSTIDPNDRSAAGMWSVCVATPETARKRFHLDINDTSVLMLNEAAAMQRDADQPPSGNEVSVVYPANNFDKLTQDLAADFERLFRMQRLFQLAGLYGDSGPMLSSRGVAVEFVPLGDEETQRNIQPLSRGELRSGDEVSVRLSNKKSKTLWYTILLVQSNGLIAPIHSGSIPAAVYSSRPTVHEIERIRLRPTRGNAAYVAITVPVLDQRKPADFSYLAQLPIGVHRIGENSVTRSVGNEENAASSTTLGGLFSMTTRSSENKLAIKDDGSQIAVRSWSVGTIAEQDESKQ